MPKKECGAKRRDGGICRSPAMPNGRCRIHGGKSLAGPAAANFKTGRYSKYLPAHLKDRYEAATSDPDLLVLRDEIGLIDARVAELMGRISTGENAVTWMILKDKFGELKKHVKSGDVVKTIEALNAVEAVVNTAVGDYLIWGEIQNGLEQRRKLVESERKRLVEIQAFIDARSAMTLVASIIDVIRRNVKDRRELSQITQELSILMQHEPKAENAIVETD